MPCNLVAAPEVQRSFDCVRSSRSELRSFAQDDRLRLTLFLPRNFNSRLGPFDFALSGGKIFFSLSRAH